MFKLRVLLSVVLLVAAWGLVSDSTDSFAASGSFSFDPATKNVAQGETFALTVKVTSDIEFTGVQTDISFDRNLLQVTDVVAIGPLEPGSFQVGIAPNNNKPAAMADANNNTGKLENVAAYYLALPGGTTIPAGTHNILTVTFSSRNSGGTSPVALNAMELIDTQGNLVPVTATAGSIVISGPVVTPVPTCGPSETPTPSPSASASPTSTVATTASPTPSPSPVCATPSPSPSPTAIPSVTPVPTPALPLVASIALQLQQPAVRPGAEFIVTLMQSTSQETTGSQATMNYDPAVIQVSTVTKGTAFSKATLIMGVAPNTGPAAIPAANSSGVLNDVAAFVIPPVTIAAGQQEFVTIKVKVSPNATGTTVLSLTRLEMLNTAGEPLGVAGSSATLTIDPNAPVVVLPKPVKVLNTGGPPSAGDGTPWAGILAISGGLLGASFVLRRKTS